MDRKLFLRRFEDALNAKSGTITESCRLDDLAAWTSIGVLGFIAMIDEDYGISSGMDGLSQCQTVADLADMVAQGVNEKSSRQAA